MGKLISGAKSVGKNIYLYSVLYCIGILGILFITIARYEIIVEKLAIVNWNEVVLLLGMLYSLPVLALTFLSKVNRTIAIMIAGVVSVIVFIVYWISTTSASEMIITIRELLVPVLGIYFLVLAFVGLPTVFRSKLR
jgi:uncharacterized membrane protein YsdA (DUF1294 family)